MKIGYINNFGNYPPQCGSSVHVFQLIRGFLHQGHEVHALQGEYPFKKYFRYKKRSSFTFMQNIDVLYLRLGGGVRQDILSLLKLLKGKKVPLVWEINAPAFERRSYKAAVVDTVWKALSGLADASICMSEMLKSYMERRYQLKRAIVIPNGSDPIQFVPGKCNRDLFSDLSEEDFIVLWAGSSQFPWQGVNLIYDVAERMMKINDKIKFVIMTQPEYLQRKASQNMTIMRHVPYFSIPDYIASVDACFALFKAVPWSPIGYYFSPLKLFDYMSCAKPVIATAQGQIQQVIRAGENGLLTDNAIDDIIQKLLFLYQNQEQARQMGQKAREDIIKYYNWDRAVKETLDLFEKLINERS